MHRKDIVLYILIAKLKWEEELEIELSNVLLANVTCCDSNSWWRLARCRHGWGVVVKLNLIVVGLYSLNK